MYNPLRPSAVVLLALGEQVETIAFNRFGSVPWSLRVPRAEVALGQVLGEGSYGVVYSASWRGRAVAVKRLKTAGMALGGVATAGGGVAGAGGGGELVTQQRELGGEELRRLQEVVETEATIMSRGRWQSLSSVLRYRKPGRYIRALATLSPQQKTDAQTKQKQLCDLLLAKMHQLVPAKT